MLEILKAYGIPEKSVNATVPMHEGTQARIIIPDGETELFNILAKLL